MSKFEKHRVQKILSNSGYCSRRKAEELIKAGKVSVNGAAIKIGDKAKYNDQICIDGKPLKKQERVYLVFNKPVGCVTSISDPNYKTIMSYIHIKERVFPIGRLDYFTSGLLLLTNDGDFANRIIHPRYETNKTYVARIDRPMDDKHITAIERGVKLEDGMTAPAKARKIQPDLIEITIHEGRNRIVRRILKKFRYRIKTLTRTKIGQLTLGGLKPGQYKTMTDRDKQLVLSRE